MTGDQYYDLPRLLGDDAALKVAQAGDSFAADSSDLSALFDGRLREVHKRFERQVHLGDPENKRTFAPWLARSIARRAAVLYSTPPIRRIVGAPDDDTRIDELAERMLLNTALDQVDSMRQLQRQIFVAFAGSTAHGGVVVRAYEPTCVARRPTAGHYDLIDADEAIALCIRSAPANQPQDQIWEVWIRNSDEAWDAVRLTGAGKFLSFVFGDFAASPLGPVLPIAHCTDAHLLGRAWLPIPQHRVDLILQIAALSADGGLIAKMEAHSQPVYKRPPGEDAEAGSSAPTDIGPDRLIDIPAEAEFSIEGHKAQWSALTSAQDRMAAMLAISEDYPPDEFWLERTLPNSALALKVAHAESNRRRASQVELSEAFERGAARKYLRVWNTLFPGVSGIEETEEIEVEYPEASFYSDTRELVDIDFKEMALQLESPVRHVMKLQRLSRPRAIEFIQRARADIEMFGIHPSPELVAEAVDSTSTTVQNPGALLDGPAPAGVDATKRPGALDSRVAANTEGASVTSAAASRLT